MSDQTQTPDTFGNSVFTIKELSNITAFCNALVKRLGMDSNEAGMFRYITPPKGHKEFLTQEEARQAIFPDKKHGGTDERKTTTIMVNLGTRAINIIAHILYGVQHMERDALVQTEREQRESRPKRPRRDKELVEYETKRKEYIRSLREQLGVGPKGRVTGEVLEKFQAKLDAWDEKHNPAVKGKSDKAKAKAKTDKPKQTSRPKARAKTDTKAKTSKTPKKATPKAETKAVEKKKTDKKTDKPQAAKPKTPKPKTPKPPVAEKKDQKEHAPKAEEVKEETTKAEEPELVNA